jgi:hypothetical protein
MTSPIFTIPTPGNDRRLVACHITNRKTEIKEKEEKEEKEEYTV